MPGSKYPSPLVVVGIGTIGGKVRGWAHSHVEYFRCTGGCRVEFRREQSGGAGIMNLVECGKLGSMWSCCENIMFCNGTRSGVKDEVFTVDTDDSRRQL